MKGKIVVLIAMMVLSLGFVGTPTTWANELTYQNVTFSLVDNSAGTLTFTIDNALNANGDWTGISSLDAFSLKDIGGTSMTLAGWGESSNELNPAGCSGGSSGGYCFSAPGGSVSLTNHMVFALTYTGTLDMTAPTLKVLFDGSTQGDGHGNLLSQVVPGNNVPEPTSLMLLGASLSGIGIWRRKTLQV